MGKDRYGCATHRSKGTCGNDRTIRRQEIEARVLSGLRERLLTPDMVATFVEAFHEEANRIAREAEAERGQLESELARAERAIAGLLAAIEDGMYQPAMKQRMAELEARKQELSRRLAEAADPPVVRLHPGIADVYRRKVAELEAALNEPEIRGEAAAILRSLIERIELRLGAGERGLDAELVGDLAAILSLSESDARNAKRPATVPAGRQLSVVAGAGFEPATFRL